MPAHHKRFAPSRDPTWRPPAHDCFACNDSGIISNADGLVNEFIPDYDAEIIDGNLYRHGGSDLALICHCKAAYTIYAPDGSTVRGGLRDSGTSEPITVQTEQGTQAVGISIDKDTARKLHVRRKQQWADTAVQMNKRQLQPTSTNTTTNNVKQQLSDASNIFGSLRVPDAA
jgi:hypothetical protein